MVVRGLSWAARVRGVSRFVRSGLRPKKISFPRLENQKLMPRLFRRGYGLGGVVRRRRRAVMKKRMYRRKKTQNKVHTFVRWADKDTLYPDSNGPNVILSQTTNQNLAYSFKLDNVVNPADFINLYDQYRINKVVLYLERLWDQTGAIGAGNPTNRKLRVVHDYNDASPLTQEDDYLEYANCKTYSPIGKNSIKITLYPKLNNVIENVGGSANAYTSVNSNRVWLNMADDEVPHFGLKIFIPANITAPDVQIFSVRAKFYLSMKNSK